VVWVLAALQEFSTQILYVVGFTAAILGLYKTYTEVVNVKKARQTQLFMSLYDHMNDAEFQAQKLYALYYDRSEMRKVKTYEEWREKVGYHRDNQRYAEAMALNAYFGGIGVLVQRKLIDIELVYDLLGSHILTTWERCNAPIVNLYLQYIQNRGGRAEANLLSFQYLYDEMKKIETARGVTVAGHVAARGAGD
jgi:hypothetical protein